ncbi:MAG: hypothetical protein ACJAXQ_001616 [Parvibaculaceae bacterium]
MALGALIRRKSIACLNFLRVAGRAIAPDMAHLRDEIFHKNQTIGVFPLID